MKKFTFILTIALVISLLAGCAGTPVVYYTNCTCPTGSHDTPVATEPAAENEATEAPVVAEGALKTGMSIFTMAEASETDGKASYDVTLAAVLVDENGVIVDCVIDSIGAEATFDATGAITSDITAEVLTKNEKGDSYGMVAWGGAIAEWYQQAEAVAQYAIGKTASDLVNGAVNESGYAADADLAASATIYIGTYVDAIIAACDNATDLGAQAGDELVLTTINSLESSTTGNIQLDVNAVALSRNGDVITSCYMDALQAKVAIAEDGTIEIGNLMTKNQLGYDYGMVAWAGATFEWFEQAANFASYVTGKTAAEVAGIAVTETTAPAEADLSASVTIAIGGFMALIAKAMQ